MQGASSLACPPVALPAGAGRDRGRVADRPAFLQTRVVLRIRRKLLALAPSRLLLVAVLCALVLNGVAFLTHRHSNDEYRGNATHAELCGLCTTFGSLGAAPAAPGVRQLPLALILLAASVPPAVPVLRRFATSARPRAPPYS